MSLAPGTMGAMKTGPKDIPGKAEGIERGVEAAEQPIAALMARDLAAWQLAKSAIAKAMGGSGT